MKAVLPARLRPRLEPKLPVALDVAWFNDHAEADAMIADADIAWIDQHPAELTRRTAALGTRLKWLTTIYAGLDGFPLASLKRRGVIVTNGNGINANAVAEYAVMGVLVAAKRYDEVVRIADRHAWPVDAPGKVELCDTSALIIGYGAIGALIGERLKAFGVAVTGVTRTGRNGTLTPGRWHDGLGSYDWVILAAPSTEATKAMIGAAELAAMKSAAWLINIARGDMVDQEALIDAVSSGRIAGAFLDTVHPEPLPPGHPLWNTPNILHSMHLSGRSQTNMYGRAAALFVDNLDAFLSGRPMKNVVDLDAGY